MKSSILPGLVVALSLSAGICTPATLSGADSTWGYRATKITRGHWKGSRNRKDAAKSRKASTRAKQARKLHRKGN
jgi:hypothetical protein